ncbi:MAG: hypothetical protein Q9191_001034 [Dirinaria sp. TL-2023a]
MTSRRIVSNEKNFLEKDDQTKFSPSASEKSNITPAVPAAVIYKLLGFTLAMVAGPIGTYFLTLNTLFRGGLLCPSKCGSSAKLDIGNSTWAGATAAVMANVVLIAYVVVAMNEDEGESRPTTEKAKKGD